MGYGPMFDLLGTGLIITTYVSTATFGGLGVAIIAALILSVVIKVLRHTEGYDVYELNSSTDMYPIIAALATQSVLWIKAYSKGLVSGQVDAPTPLNGTWIHAVDAPLSSVISQMWRRFRAIKW